MNPEPTANRTDRPRKVVALLQRRQRRSTPLARRRRLNALIRELALDFGLDLKAVTLAERGVLHQLGTLLMQIEVSADQLVGGATVDADVVIRLTSEARRLLAGLRKRAQQEAPPSSPVWSPLRARLNAAASAPAPEPEPAS
jgi:hypothetical protein